MPALFENTDETLRCCECGSRVGEWAYLISATEAVCIRDYTEAEACMFGVDFNE